MVVRQARSEATRQKIIVAAVDLFAEVGYPATALTDIIERTQLTKGAFYYHFDSKDSLTAAIAEEGAATVVDTFQAVCESPSPALENMIHGTFVVANLIVGDKLARTGIQLARALGQFNEVTADVYRRWLAAMVKQARQASSEGDLQPDLDPDLVGESILAAILGTELISNATSGGADFIHRLSRMWGILLAVMVSDESLPYIREFLKRESLRRLEPSLRSE